MRIERPSLFNSAETLAVTSKTRTSIKIISKTLVSSIFIAVSATLLAGCGLLVDNQDRIERAEQAMSAGDFRAAIIDAKAVLIEEPENIAARVLLGKASVAIGDATTAELELRRAIGLGTSLADVAVDLGGALNILGRYEQVVEEITVDSVVSDNDKRDVNLVRGNALIGLNRAEDARESFGEVLKIDATNLGAQLGVVSSYVVDGNLPQARATLDNVIERNPDSVATWLGSADLAIQSGNIVRAEADFERALGLAIEQEDLGLRIFALKGLGQARLAQNKTDEASLTVAALTEIAPESIDTNELAARLAVAREDWTTAQEELQAILRQAPDYRPAQLLLGAVHLQSGNLGQAEMYLSAVVAALPGNADARQYLAETRYRLNRSDAARETLRPMLEGPEVDTRSLEMAARASLNAGDFDYAARYLQRAVDADPENPEPQLGLAIAYLMANRLDDAEAILANVDVSSSDDNLFRRDLLNTLSMAGRPDSEDALASAKALADRYKDNPLLMNLVGALEMANGNNFAARENFLAAIEIAPTNLMSKRYIAAVDEADGNFDAAIAHYRQILDLRAGDTSAMLALARISAIKEDYSTSQSWLEQAISSDPENIELRSYLGRLLLALGDFDGARQSAEEALSVAPDNALTHWVLGNALLNLGDERGAQDSFERAVELAPNDANIRIDLARAQEAQGNRDTAIDTVAIAYEQNPTNIRVATLLASTKVEEGDLDGAMAIARTLKQEHPDSPIPLSLESEILVRQGRLNEAVAVYDKVLEIEKSARYAIRAYQIRSAANADDPVAPMLGYLEERPLDIDVRSYLGQVYQGEGQNSAAIGEYEKVMEYAPDNHVAANNLAWLYFTQGDPRAEQVARRAYELAPDNDSIMDTLGWILVKKGDAAGGVDLLRKADAKSGGRPEIRYHLAVGLSQSERNNEARKLLTDLISSDQQFTSRNAAEKLLREL